MSYPPHISEAPELRYEAEFLSVVDGSDGVMICLFEEPLVDGTLFTSEGSTLELAYFNLTEKLEKARPWKHPELAPRSRWASGPGFWRVDDTIVRDNEGFVRVYEFEDLSFDIMVPANVPIRCFE